MARISRHTLSGNIVDILIEGEEIFDSLKIDIEAVNSNGFIYVAFWKFDPDLVLDAHINSRPKLADFLRDKALNGTSVRILIWDFFTRSFFRLPGVPGFIESLISTAFAPVLSGVLPQNPYVTLVDKTEEWVNRVRSSGSGGTPDIEVCIASFPDQGTPPARSQIGGVFSLGSHHQKLVILDPEGHGDVIAYVLGVNASNEYYDNQQHQPEYPDAQNPLRDRPWHDAGVRVQGPGANLVKKEFVLRWNQHYNRFPMFRASIFRPSITPLPYVPDSSSVQGQGKLRLFTTSGSQSQPLIVDALKNCLRNASKSVYIEDQYFSNYELFDVLIDACLSRQRQQQWLHIALLTNSPQEFQYRNVDIPMEIYRWINFTNLQFCTCESIDLNSGDQIVRQPGEDWRLNPRSGHERWDIVNLSISTHRGPVQFRNIRSINEGVRPAYIVSSQGNNPAVYVHSKLTIIDDQYIFIGSANYSVRSMEYDSEADFEITDEDLAKELRQNLFEEMLGQQLSEEVEVSEQFDLWHQTARNNAAQNPSSGNPHSVLLMEYPRAVFNLQRLQQIEASLRPVFQYLEDLLASSENLTLNQMLDDLYPFH